MNPSLPPVRQHHGDKPFWCQSMTLAVHLHTASYCPGVWAIRTYVIRNEVAKKVISFSSKIQILQKSTEVQYLSYFTYLQPLAESHLINAKHIISNIDTTFSHYETIMKQVTDSTECINQFLSVFVSCE